jgi:hypothetical protein
MKCRHFTCHACPDGTERLSRERDDARVALRAAERGNRRLARELIASMRVSWPDAASAFATLVAQVAEARQQRDDALRDLAELRALVARKEPR